VSGKVPEAFVKVSAEILTRFITTRYPYLPTSDSLLPDEIWKMWAGEFGHIWRSAQAEAYADAIAAVPTQIECTGRHDEIRGLIQMRSERAKEGK
jgi:hypothetical protein